MTTSKKALFQRENNDKMECEEIENDHDSEEIDPGTESQLQIDESEDVDVTEPDSKSMRLDSEANGYTDHTGN